MKKKIIIATLIICVVFCMLLSHKEYRNYKITNITLSEIVIKDSLLNLRKGNRYFLLEFMVDYCNSSLTYIIHSGFISGYQNRYGDNLKPPTNVYHRMTA